jgi:hypothetical protein
MRNVATTIVTITFTMFLSTGPAFGQGNLQFSRVLLVSSAQTVPVGTVWKVESAMINSAMSPPASCNTHIASAVASILVNGNAVHVHSTHWGMGTGCISYDRGPSIHSANLTTFPLWLPANTTLAASTSVTYVSVMEFNITP